MSEKEYTDEEVETMFRGEEEKRQAKLLEEKNSNDGGHNNFYDFPHWVTNIDTLAEYLKLDGYDFNVLKTLTVNLGARHDGTNIKRELNKRLHYVERAIEKFNRPTD